MSEGLRVRITSKGRITIPSKILKKLRLLPGSEVEFRLEGDSVRLVKIPTKRARSRGAGVIEGLRGKGDVKLSTDEILALMGRTK